MGIKMRDQKVKDNIRKILCAPRGKRIMSPTTGKPVSRELAEAKAEFERMAKKLRRMTALERARLGIV